jgi:hypothetical protein
MELRNIIKNQERVIEAMMLEMEMICSKVVKRQFSESYSRTQLLLLEMSWSRSIQKKKQSTVSSVSSVSSIRKDVKLFL